MPRVLLVTLALAFAAASPVRADDVAQVCDPPVTTNCVIRQDKTFFPATPSFDVGDLNLRVSTGHTLTVAASLTSPGQLTLKAGSVVIEPGASVIVSADPAGNGGRITFIATRGITLQVSGVRQAIIAATGSLRGGTINLVAGGDVLVNGLLNATGSPGSGGEIDVSGNGITIQGTDLIQAPGGVQGIGGSVSVIGKGAVLLASSINATGTIGGGSLDLESLSDFTTLANAPLLVNSVDTGGDVLFDVRGSVTIGAKIDLSGQPGPGFGGSGGEIDMLVDGDITVNAPIDLSGTPPDGAGGLADLEAGGSFTQIASAPILAGAGSGTDSGGGDVSITALKDLQMGPVDTSGGGFGGGSIDAESQGLTTTVGEANADGDDAGDITLVGMTVQVTANVHALAQVGGAGGTVSLAGCELDVPQGGTMAVTGSASGALLQASGAMTIGGTITSEGPNSFQYLDILPVILGSAVIQPPTTPVRNSRLPTCANLFPGSSTTTTTVPGATTTTTSTLVGTTTTTTSTVSTTTTSTLPGGTTSSTSTSTSFTTTSSSTVSTSSSTSSTSSTSSSSSSTTSSSAPSSSTTTSSVTSSSSSSSVTSTTSSTTTSTRPECSASDLTACDDGDRCTIDACPAGLCTHDQKGDVDGVTCKLETLDADLTAAGSANLGGRARATALIAKVGKARSLVEASRALTGRKHLKKLKGASKQVGVFAKLVRRGQTQGKIAGPMATTLLGLASDATSRLQHLITP